MDPSRWSSLPRELLPLVFARLPLPQLLSLHRSAVEGKWGIDLNGAEFLQLCVQRWQPKSNMCAVLLKEANSATYNVGVVHSKKKLISWQKLRVNRREPVNTMCSSNAGLVCFCLTFQSGPKAEGDSIWLTLAVVNPLTGACRVLPKHGVSPFQLKMMQLVVDKETNHYQVILVYDEGTSSDRNRPSIPLKDQTSSASPREDCSDESSDESSEGSKEEFPPLRAVIFSSESGVWTNAKDSSQLFFGPTIYEELYVREPEHGWVGSRFRTHKMDGCGCTRFFGPCAYESSIGQVLSLYKSWLDDSTESRDFALMKDHLFMLELEWHGDMLNRSAEYTLSEHEVQVQEEKLSWTQLNCDLLGPGEHDKLDGGWDETELQLLACEGFLLVRGSRYSTHKYWPVPRCEVALLCNVGTGEWLNLQKRGDAPAEGKEEREFSGYGDDPHDIGSSPIVLCELDWEAVP